MPTSPRPNMPGIKAIIAALEQMQDDMIGVGFHVEISIPYGHRPSIDEPEIAVDLRFVVPARVAKRHGFSESRGLPQKTQQESYFEDGIA